MSIKETGTAPVIDTGKKSLAERIAGLTPEQRVVYERKRRELQKKTEKPRIPRRPGLLLPTRLRCGLSSSWNHPRPLTTSVTDSVLKANLMLRCSSAA